MRIRYQPRAIGQIQAIHDWLVERVGRGTADRVVEGLFARCESLHYFPLRGTPRDDVRPDMRTIPHRRRYSIGYVVQGDVVVILGVRSAGQDWDVLTDS